MSWPPKCPLLAVDVICIYSEGPFTKDGGGTNTFVAIERKNPPLGLALPGGFVDEGESVEDAARREIREELNLELKDLRMIGVFSDPKRDPRRHVVSVAFWAFVKDPYKAPVAADDAKSFKFVSLKPREYKSLDWCFDHEEIISKAH